jgi:hypothetical protein
MQIRIVLEIIYYSIFRIDKIFITLSIYANDNIALFIKEEINQ